eukprot:763794-Hanusia_phi.AAC.7
MVDAASDAFCRCPMAVRSRIHKGAAPVRQYRHIGSSCLDKEQFFHLLDPRIQLPLRVQRVFPHDVQDLIDRDVLTQERKVQILEAKPRRVVEDASGFHPEPCSDRNCVDKVQVRAEVIYNLIGVVRPRAPFHVHLQVRAQAGADEGRKLQAVVVVQLWVGGRLRRGRRHAEPRRRMYAVGELDHELYCHARIDRRRVCRFRQDRIASLSPLLMPLRSLRKCSMLPQPGSRLRSCSVVRFDCLLPHAKSNDMEACKSLQERFSEAARGQKVRTVERQNTNVANRIRLVGANNSNFNAACRGYFDVQVLCVRVLVVGDSCNDLGIACKLNLTLALEQHHVVPSRRPVPVSPDERYRLVVLARALVVESARIRRTARPTIDAVFPAGGEEWWGGRVIEPIGD